MAKVSHIFPTCKNQPLLASTMAMNVEAEFMKAYDRYADALFRHCFFRVYHHELAKDLVQQTFMRVWQYLASGHQVENLRALLYTTATRLVIDEARKRRPVESLESLSEDGFQPGSNPRSGLEAQIDAAHLIGYLNQLGEDERTVIVMRYIDELSPKEIATILAESPNVISVRLHRSVKKLRALLPPTYVLPF